MKGRAHEDVRAYTIKGQGGSLRRGVPLFYVRIAVEKTGTGSRPHALWGAFARRGELRMTTLKKAARTRTCAPTQSKAITNQKSTNQKFRSERGPSLRSGLRPTTFRCGCVGTGRR